jgi:hypothetical protein
VTISTKRDDHNTVVPNLKIILTVNQRASYHQIDRKFADCILENLLDTTAIDKKNMGPSIQSSPATLYGSACANQGK